MEDKFAHELTINMKLKSKYEHLWENINNSNELIWIDNESNSQSSSPHKIHKKNESSIDLGLNSKKNNS